MIPPSLLNPAPARASLARRAAGSLGRTLRFWMQTEVHVYAFSVAANVLLSFFAFLIVSVSLAQFFFNRQLTVAAIDFALRDYFPDALGQFLHNNLPAPRPVELLSIVLLLISANGIFEPLEVALNRVWGIHKNRSFFRNQLVSLMLIFACGALALFSLGMTALQHRASVGVAGADLFTGIFFKFAAMSLAAVVLVLIYRFLPNGRPPMDRVIPAAVGVGVLLEALKGINTLLWPWFDAKLSREYGVFRYSVTLIFLGFFSTLLVLAGAEWAARGHRLDGVRMPRVAVVTGASSGLGSEFARKLAARGFDLLLVARREDRLRALARELGEQYRITADALPADLTDAAALEEVASRVQNQPGLGLLVNNAGFGTNGYFFETDAGSQTRMHLLHVVATTRLTHAALANIVPRGEAGTGVINVSSVAAFGSSPMNVSYCATKAWMNRFSEGLALELAGRGSPVTIQALCPGFVLSEFHDVLGIDRTRMPSWLWMTPDFVVKESLRGFERRTLVVVPGWRYKVLVAVMRVVPGRLQRIVSARAVRRYRLSKTGHGPVVPSSRETNP